jgi:predicted ATPase/transcriptional regulator with XRE-family HTH domain
MEGTMSSLGSTPEPIIHSCITNGSSVNFGQLLRQTRRRAGMTLADLAAAVGYSVAHVGNLETSQRLPDVAVVMQKFIPALGLEREPQTARCLVELAAATRGERPPTVSDTYQGMDSDRTNPAEDRRSNLPYSLAPLLGREQTIKTVVHRLLDHTGRLFTLVGPPGIGKTTLGLAVAAHLQASFVDGVWYVPLVTVTDPEMVGPAIMAALGLAESKGSTRSPKSRLLDYLRRKQTLLLLDNFEQLTPATSLLVDLLQECPGLHVLVTSRTALRSRAEQRFTVPVLGLGDAVPLFVQRARAVESEFVVTDEIRPVVEEICTRLDCLPLAIELIAVQVDLFTPQELNQRLRNRPLDLLRYDAPDLDSRHQTLRTAIHWSYLLLSPQEQALFRRLGVFSGGFELSAVEAIVASPAIDSGLRQEPIANEPLDPCSAPLVLSLLSALRNKSLVQAETQSNGERRFRLLETLREYALEQLAAHDELEHTRRSHAAYFCRLAEAAHPALFGPDEISWLDRLEREHDNLRAAMAWCLERPQDRETGLRIVAMMWLFWYGHSYLTEGLVWLQRALDLAQDARPALRAKLLQGATNFYWSNDLPDYRQRARPLIEESIALYRQCGDQWNLAKSLGYVGFCTESYAEFVPAAEEAKRLFAAVNDPWGYAWIIFMEGFVAQPYLDEIPLETSVTLMRERGAKTGLALALQMQGYKAYYLGDIQRARSSLEEAVLLWRQIGNKWVASMALLRLGDLLREQHEYHLVATLYAEALQLAQQVGDHQIIADCYYCQGLLTLALGDPQLAGCQVRKGFAYLLEQKSLDLKPVAKGLRCLAVIADQQAEYSETVRLFGAAESLWPAVGRYNWMGNVELFQASLEAARTQLCSDEFAAAWAAGQTLSLAQSVEYALNEASN